MNRVAVFVFALLGVLPATNLMAEGAGEIERQIELFRAKCSQ